MLNGGSYRRQVLKGASQSHGNRKQQIQKHRQTNINLHLPQPLHMELIATALRGSPTTRIAILKPRMIQPQVGRRLRGQVGIRL